MQIEEHNSKKQSFAERLFSHSKKENQPPILMQFNYKDLEQQLNKERQANKILREEIFKLKLESGQSCKKYVINESAREIDKKNTMERLNWKESIQQDVPHR